MNKYNLVVIGGGPAGMAAALEAEQNGVKDILLLERDKYPGGILQQCIHNGFGLEYFKKELTGPEYADQFIDKLKKSSITVKTGAMVIKITRNKEIVALNRSDGLLYIKAKTIVLAMGCRERTRESIIIPGDRPAGILTAGTAQRYVNIEGFMPGKDVVILGSGDIGLIMARRMTLEGANVKLVLEIMPYSTGLIRNKVQCLDDFNIPLKLSHTIIRINGDKRVESVIISKVDEQRRPIPGTEEEIKCDTVLLSVGLIPENELTGQMGIVLDKVTGGPIVNEIRETEVSGVFTCGNVLQVHDLVDFVTEEGEIAGQAVSKYLNGENQKRDLPVQLETGNNVSYIVPHRIEYQDKNRKRVKLFLRVKKPAEDVKVKLINNDNQTLIAYKKDIVTPGEMVSVFLPEALINDNINKIKISVEKEGM